MDDAARFIRVFRLAALQAGWVARRLQGKVRSEPKKGQTSPEGAALTSVDLAAQDIILLLLHDAFPEANMDAEEETETVRLFPSRDSGRPTIVVDPLDGTLNYIKGSPDFAVMGGWIESGVYRSAVVHFPHFGRIYWARQGQSCWVQADNEEPVEVRIGPLPSRALVVPRVPENQRQALRSIGLEVMVSRCSAVEGTAPVSGRAAAALSVGRPDRRRAIGCFLTLEAGGTIWTGDRFWGGEDPLSMSAYGGSTIVSGSRAMVERILSAME